jgi:uncharacterized protein (DUF2267 family)
VSEARDLVEQLPPELGPWLLTDADGAAEGFDVDEFLRRVASRAGVDMAAAELRARARDAWTWRRSSAVW